MCGIAGSINHVLDIPQLTKDLWHRGPDEQSTLLCDPLQLHHHRLSILDIAGGKQPMKYLHLTIIFNGEIYNHQELRKKYGLTDCHTHSDTETILRLYHKLGPACLNDMDGMFALAIFDREKDELFIARDRAGKKPLYYFADGRKFIFSSELNALQRQLPLQVNDVAISQYIRMGYFYKEATPYQSVFELPGGSYMKISLSRLEPHITKWWDIHTYYNNRSSDTFEVAMDTVDQILHQAVRNRVESSDLEVGSFLSGGIDSGIVTAIARSYNSKLKTFTVSFDAEYDEAPLAKMVADKYQTDHHEIRISFDHLVNDVEKIIGNYGEPFFDSSAIPSYYVSQAARKYITVILNGDGGDEVFAGYRRYVPFARYDFFNPGSLAKLTASTLNRILPLPHNKKSIYNYIYRLTDLARRDGFSTYLSATIDSFEGYEEYLLTQDHAFDNVKKDFELINRSNLTGLQKIMNLDFNNILTGNLLVKMDIATMAHSLEGRSPLLCKGLLEYVPSLPDRYKIYGSQTKHILRKLAEKYLPPTLINQPKRGFEIPLKQWVDGQLKPVINDYLLNSNAYSRNFVKHGFIENLLNRKFSVGDEKRAKMIWTLFALEVWYKKYYLKHA